jgi:aminoglycoside phosphotransferase family enzyme/predicted kinase
MTHPRLIETMMSTNFYPHQPAVVELVQTHISYVFIAGDIVYKIKKPVNFGFLDFTSLEKRKFYCEEELRLNKRLAPSIYLDVSPIAQDSAGNLCWGSTDHVVEYAVRMKKLPLEKMLKTLLANGVADEKIMGAVSRKIAAFHQSAETGGRIDEMGRIATIRHNHEENFDQTVKYINTTIPQYQYNFIRNYADIFLKEKKNLFEKRIADHKIRDCHGDLHLEHICIADEIIIFDCIEFNERFRFSDVAAEVAFLTMDLDFNGYPQQAQDFVRSYLKYSSDADMPALLNFYRCYYAYVRGKVISFKYDQKEIPAGERTRIVKTAARYFDLAYTYSATLEKPVLILTAGLIGSGKSYQARHLAPQLGAKVIRTDVLRKEMLNLQPSERHHDDFGAGIYSGDITRRTYDRAYELAEQIIRRGQAVIIDASFRSRDERRAAMNLAQKLGVPFYIIECFCPDAVARKRLENRMLDKNNPSDGRWEILQEQKKHYEEINEVPCGSHWIVDTSAGSEIIRQEIIRQLKMADF